MALLAFPSFAQAEPLQTAPLNVTPGDMSTGALAADGAGVGKLWARSKIAALETKHFTESGASQIDKAIEKVALAHHLVSSQTSLIAVPPNPGPMAKM